MKVLHEVQSPIRNGMREHPDGVFLQAMADDNGNRIGWRARYSINFNTHGMDFKYTQVFGNQYDAYITAIAQRTNGLARRYPLDYVR